MKKLFILMLVVTLMVGVVGCGAKEDLTSTDSDIATDENAVIEEDVVEKTVDENGDAIVDEDGNAIVHEVVDGEVIVEEDTDTDVVETEFLYSITFLKITTDDAGNKIPEPFEKNFTNGDFDNTLIEKLNGFVEKGTEVLPSDLPDTANTGDLPTYSIFNNEGIPMSVWVNDDITFFAYDASTYILSDKDATDLRTTLETLFAE